MTERFTKEEIIELSIAFYFRGRESTNEHLQRGRQNCVVEATAYKEEVGPSR